MFWEMLDENLQKVQTFYETQLTSFLEQFHVLTLQVRAFASYMMALGSSYTVIETLEPLINQRPLFFLTCRIELRLYPGNPHEQDG